MWDDWVDRAMSCFFRPEPDKPPDERIPSTRSSSSSAPDIDPILLLSEEQLNKAFENFVAELDLSAEKQKELLEQPAEKKIAMLSTKTVLEEHLAEDGEDAEGLVQWLVELRKRDKFDVDSNFLVQLQTLVITLRTQTHSFVERFLSAGGLEALDGVLQESLAVVGRDRLALFVLCAIRALLNSSSGRTAVIQKSDVIVDVAVSIELTEPKCKIVSVEILSGLCFVPNGHQAVLDALTKASERLGERTRFQRHVLELHRRFATERETDRVRTALMSLVNALLSTGVAESSVEFRQHVRCELLMLGLQEAIEKARAAAASHTLNDHFDLFEMMRREDEQHLQGSSDGDSGSSSPVDFESATGMAEALSERLHDTVAHPHFVSLLQHLLMVPCDAAHIPLWRLFDLVVQQLSLQATVEAIHDERAVLASVDMNEILSRLHTQADYETLEKEQERLKEELQTERLRNLELENRLADLSDGRSSVSSGISCLSSPSDRSSPLPPAASSSASSLPPVAPPSCLPPPPPPPSIEQLKSFGGLAPPKPVIKKKVPEPPAPLKSLNWTVIPREKTTGTVWEFIEDEKLYKQLDLTELSTSFAAGAQHDDDTSTVHGSIGRRPNRDSPISVIDPRKAHNCTIMLSKLKLSNREIRSCLLGMDEKQKIPRDMIEQIIKFLPTKEEILMLNETVTRFHSPSVLALADRFLYEISQVPRFEQRLKCLSIIRGFKERVEDLTPAMQSSTALTSSKRMKQTLALVLAIGNYLNYGKRTGNASGFEISGLLLLTGVKNTSRADRSLVHYLIEVIDRKFSDLLKMKRELASIYEAARFCRKEATAEMKALDQAIATVRNELSLLARASPMPPSDTNAAVADRFESALKEFVEAAAKDFQALDRLFTDMKSKYGDCAKQFCFDSASSPDDFFGILAKFLNTFAEAQDQIWRENEEKERVKRQTLARNFFAKKSRKRDKDRDFEQLISALQSGELFSEELSRLRTSFRVPKTAVVR